MSIQDIILTLGSLTFFVALLPSVLSSKDKPHLYTSVSTALTLYIFAGTYYSLELYFSSVVTILTAGLWTTLAWQKFKDREKLSLHDDKDIKSNG